VRHDLVPEVSYEIDRRRKQNVRRRVWTGTAMAMDMVVKWGEVYDAEWLWMDPHPYGPDRASKVAQKIS